MPLVRKFHPSHNRKSLLPNPVSNRPHVNFHLIHLETPRTILLTSAMVYTSKQCPKPRPPAPHRNAPHLHVPLPLVIPTSRGERTCRLVLEQCSVKAVQAEILVACWIEWADMLDKTGTNATRFRLELTTSLVARQSLI